MIENGGGIMAEVGKLKQFEEMAVWQDARELVVGVYRDFASCKDFSFTDQIKRAAVSVTNNIAEGSERSTTRDFARFLDIAKGSVGEVRSMYLIAEKLSFVSSSTVADRSTQCHSISRQLGGFTKHLRKRENGLRMAKE